ncbi:PREDICTED: uncharacterized protein LOC104772425 [Camelina sativa]|uniref:Uncharacterized protein LOC104772424 n=1 Tax=Camelina sativa TaxID=90675 RepID=A0ABM0Y4I6_CAMSA|nr:PREDICTED: uncharacterized protein LOC104772424 [Camelina sativa]XP_010495344.1 PREDICTED: uncharacterized protein LOC104772425 [Camelina sativa]
MDRTIEPYSSSSLHISNCVTIKLTEQNYFIWKSQFESFLRTQSLLGFVNGAAKPPSEKIPIRNNNNGKVEDILNPDFESWSRSDQVVKAWLLGSMTENVLRLVIGSVTAQEVWDTLISHFNRTSSSRLFELQRRLQNAEKLDKSMSDYLRGIKDICDQLASIGDPISEKMKIFAALRGLSREYEPIITVIEDSMDRSPAPTYDNVISRLTGYDDRIQGYSASADISPHLAFHTSRSSGYQHRGRGNRGRGRGSYSTRGRGFQQQFSSTTSSRPSTNNSSEKPVRQICGKRGHNAFECWFRFDEEYQQPAQPAISASAFLALHIPDVTEDNSWYPDSAATAHITSSTQRLQQAQPYHGSDMVMASDGNFLPITHVGSANLPSMSGNIPLKDVLVCPEIAKSLLSVSKLTKDYPCAITFDDLDVVIKDKASLKVLTKGKENNGLY